MNPLISVIIPFYNTPKREFYRCINSLQKQTFTDFEVIIIDDGSCQECKSYLNSVGELDERIKIIYKQNQGSAIARNVGIEAAKGEYIMFLDSDDAITDYCLEEGSWTIKKYNPDLVIGCAKRVTKDEIDKIIIEEKGEAKTLYFNSCHMRNVLMSHMIGYTSSTFELKNGYIGDGPWARLLKKSIAVKEKFSEENMWSDDTIWNAKMLSKCNDIVVIDSLWYKYLIFNNSKTRRFRPNCPYEFSYRTRQELDLFKKLWPNSMQGLYVRIFNDITLLCRTYLFHADNKQSFRDNYRIYKKCIHENAYREALNSLKLKDEKRLFNRLTKEVLRFTSYHGPHYISYFILWSFYHLRKNQL